MRMDCAKQISRYLLISSFNIVSIICYFALGFNCMILSYLQSLMSLETVLSNMINPHFIRYLFKSPFFHVRDIHRFIYIYIHKYKNMYV